MRVRVMALMVMVLREFIDAEELMLIVNRTNALERNFQAGRASYRLGNLLSA